MPKPNKTDAEKAATNRLRTETGQRLRLTRRALGLSQEDFAARAGMSQNMYNQVEQGKKGLSVESAIAFCNAYKLSLDWIFRDEPGDMSARLWTAIAALRAIEDGNDDD